MSSRTGKGVVRLGVRRNSHLSTNTVINCISDARLFLQGVRLSTDLHSMSVHGPSVHGRVTILRRRVTATGARRRQRRGLIHTGTNGRGRLSSVIGGVGCLRGRLSTRCSSLDGAAKNTSTRTRNLRCRVVRLSSRLVGDHVLGPRANAMLIGCTRPKRIATTNGPLCGVTSASLLCLHTCIATSRLSRLGLKRSLGIFTSCKGSHQRCPNAVA